MTTTSSTLPPRYCIQDTTITMPLDNDLQVPTNSECLALQADDTPAKNHTSPPRRKILYYLFVGLLGLIALVVVIFVIATNNSRSEEDGMTADNESLQILAGNKDIASRDGEETAASKNTSHIDTEPAAAFNTTINTNVTVDSASPASPNTTFDLTIAPTTAPTSSPITTSPTIATTTAPDFKEEGCLPDRFDNEGMDLTVDPDVNFNKLFPGQYICSKPYNPRPNDPDKVPQRYQFGMTTEGDVVWEDTVKGTTVTVFENPHPRRSKDDVYFSLTTNATMVYHHPEGNPNSRLITLPPISLNHPMSDFPTRCLSNHDCPYLHLHSDGVLVMNYIAGDGNGWQATNFLRVYGLN